MSSLNVKMIGKLGSVADVLFRELGSEVSLYYSMTFKDATSLSEAQFRRDRFVNDPEFRCLCWLSDNRKAYD